MTRDNREPLPSMGDRFVLVISVCMVLISASHWPVHAQPCSDPGTYSFGWSLEPIVGGEVWDERLLGEPFVGGGALEVSGDFSLYGNAVSNQVEVGVEGWSIIIESTGYAVLDAIGTEGTAADPARGFFNGGFNKTSLAGCFAGSRCEASSAVILCFGCPNVLPLDTTETLLRVDIGFDLTGEPNGSIRLTDGFRDAQPVRTVYSVAGESIDLCNNPDVALDVVLHSLYRRGDSNGDDRIDIADAIWIVAELLLDGPASSCPPATDINGDAGVDLADVTYLLNFNFLGGPPPPEPIAECGAAEALCITPCSE